MSSDGEKPSKLSRRLIGKKGKQLSSGGFSGKFGRRQGSESSQASFATASNAVFSTTESPIASEFSEGSQSLFPLKRDDVGTSTTQAPVLPIKTGRQATGSSISSLDISTPPLNVLHTVSEVITTSPEAMSPEAMSPEAMSPEAMSPESSFERAATPSKSSYDRDVRSPSPSSKNHWNYIRNAIIPLATTSTSRINAIAMPSGNNPPQPATASLPRLQTPKPSKLARLGFRQVVEQAREVIHDEAGKFAEDIFQACNSARFGPIRSTTGSQSGYRPFMSQPSLSLSLNASTVQVSKPSQMNEAPAQGSPSIRLLHHKLVHYASSSGPSQSISQLPYETEVLSVLLLPFLNNATYEAEEQWLAIESFEIAVATWVASSKQREVERVLWCCKAGLLPPSPICSRVLGTLSTLLFSSTPAQFASPLALQNIVQGLYQLLHAFTKRNENSSADVEIVRELCARVSSGGCGQPETKDIENEYGAQWTSDDIEASIRSQIIAEGMARCMHSGSEGLRRWMLNVIEREWPALPSRLTPLCIRIVSRRLAAFFRSAISLLRSEKGRNDILRVSDARIILRILERNALSEINQLRLERETSDEYVFVVELLLQLLVTQSPPKIRVAELLCGWYRDDAEQGKDLLSALSCIVEKTDWSHLIPMVQSVLDNITEKEGKEFIKTILSSIHKRLIIDPISTISGNVIALFQSLAKSSPQEFYKPLISLATAVKDPTLVAHFSVVTAVARYLPDFWIRDSEMMAFALIGDVKTIKSQTPDNRPAWAKPRIGQLLIALELIRQIRQLSKDEHVFSPPDGSQTEAFRFAIGLDLRLAVLLEGKGNAALAPLSQRILLSVLLLEIRLFTRSLEPALWLPTVITWAAQGYVGANLQKDPRLFSETGLTPQVLVTMKDFDEILSTMERIRSIFIASWQTPTHSRQRSAMAFSRIFDSVLSPGIVDFTQVHSSAIKEREELMASLPKTVSSAVLRLLVAVSVLLNRDEHRKLVPVLWSNYLDTQDPKVVEPACFLFMHCLEKSAAEVTPFLIGEQRKSDSLTKLNIIRRLMTLFSWRFQILTQTYLSDKARRRPFRLARHPLSFMPIDVGSPIYVHEKTEEDHRNLPGGSLPFELRRRLAEFGWQQDDQPTDTRIEKIRSPMSLFSSSQLHEAAGIQGQRTDSALKDSKKLLRRKLSGGSNQDGKRRPVFLPALVIFLPSITPMTTDPDPFVAAAAREALLIMLREDPALVCRPIMDILSTDIQRVGEVVTMLRAILHIHCRLPPSTSHHIFGNLGGFLKHISRESVNPNVFGAFASVAPILAKLVTQVSDLNIRDLRRSKFEIYVFPTGSLWFPPTAPASLMFPRSLDKASYHEDKMPEQLGNICMIRTAQNMLFLDMLKRRPQEVLTMRKNLLGFTLPGENTRMDLDGNSFIPRRDEKIRRKTSYQQVSIALSRSHLLLLGQIFRSVPRNFSGKAELTSLFNGLNRILIAHGDDIGIVAHALIACMIGVTRFKRFIASTRGFSFFMPALLKVYVEAEGHSSICQAIKYASSRFYAIHQEGYVFQSLDLASKILVRIKTSEDKDWFSQKIWDLFATLKSTILPSTPDAAGIRDCNRVEERESLIATTVGGTMPLLTVRESPEREQLKKILAIGEYESKLLPLDDLVKLLLTIIAHDTAIIRSQNFLALLRHMVPKIYHGSKSARNILREGIGALGPALFPKTARQKAPEAAQGRSAQPNESDGSSRHEANEGIEHFKDEILACDPLTMRREYLRMIVSFIQVGGDLPPNTIRYALEIVKGLLKEPDRPNPEVEVTFLNEYTKAALNPQNAKHALSLLREIVPVIRTSALITNCSGVLDAITNLLTRSDLAHNDSFVRFIVEEIGSPLLDACQDAASKNMLMSLPMRKSLITLMSYTAALKNADIVGIIERQDPSPAFLSGIVLPLCMKIKTSAEIAIEDPKQSKAQATRHGFVFLRILGYIMDACKLTAESEGGRASPSPGLIRRESERSMASTTTSRTPLARMSVAMQIIKVIVSRAAEDISTGLIGTWARLAQFLKQLLADGDAEFALASIASPSGSPWQTPGSSPTHGPERESLSSDDHARPPTSGSSNLRVVDYLTWSLLEFLCCMPSPLNLQMRLFMQEKVCNLDAGLKAREVRSFYLARGSRRLSSSVFARSRGSSTPSDVLRASNTFSRVPSELNLSASLSPDYDIQPRFPPSPDTLHPPRSGPRIIHLGPAKNHHGFDAPPLDRSLSTDSHLKSLARKTCIALPVLIRMTEDRIRVVQACMGYDRLLPLKGQDNDPAPDIKLKTWTKASILVMLAEETNLLMDEFPENFYEIVGGGFVDVPTNYGSANTLIESPTKKPVLF